MGIYGFMKKIPGGILVVPLLIGAVINTVFPNLFSSLGGMTQALFSSGTLAFAGLILFATGATLDIKDISTSLKRGGVLSLTKLILAFVVSFLFVKVFGLAGVLGVNSLAFVSAMCSSNPGVYLGVVDECGDSADKGNYALLNIVAMPAIPVFIISTASNSGFNYLEIVTVFVPFILGIIVGNLDKGVAKLFNATIPIALPFLGFCFGASVNLVSAVKAGLGGLLLVAVYLIINAVVLIPVDRWVLKRPGYAGAAMCSTAGICMAVPAMMGAGYEQYAQDAVSQLALTVIITSFAAPYLAKWALKSWSKKHPDAKTSISEQG